MLGKSVRGLAGCGSVGWRGCCNEKMDQRVSYSVLLVVTRLLSLLHSVWSETSTEVHIVTMQKNSEFLSDWVHYHGHIFGYDKLTVIDTDSSPLWKSRLQTLSALGIHVVLENDSAFEHKRNVMTKYMKKMNDKNSFLVPLDIDEFIVAANYGGKRFTSFTMNKTTILEQFRKLPVPENRLSGRKYKFNTFEAIDCNVEFNLQLPVKTMIHHSHAHFVEDKYSHARCNAKTFYHSRGFLWTDDGNHFGEVTNETEKCFVKHFCKECYTKFMKSGLGLLHYSLDSMNYNEIKAKMINRFTSLKHFGQMTTLSNCSRFKNNVHYCKFNALLLDKGDQYMMNRLRSKRRDKCNKNTIMRHNRPSIIFSGQRWSSL